MKVIIKNRFRAEQGLMKVFRLVSFHDEIGGV